MTINDIIIKIREKAKLYPGNIYTKPRLQDYCSYNKGNNSECSQKGCIFGIVFRELGSSLVDEGDIETMLRHRELDDNMNKVCWCSEVQMNQDTGMTWRKAVQLADERYP